MNSTNYAEARADMRASEAAVAVAKLNLEYTEVRSPIDGRIGRALVRPGNSVSGGDMIPLLTRKPICVTVPWPVTGNGRVHARRQIRCSSI